MESASSLRDAFTKATKIFIRTWHEEGDWKCKFIV